MQKFELVLKNEKEKTYRFIGWLIVICNIVGLFYLSASTNFQKWGYMVIAAIITIYIIIVQFLKTKKKVIDFTVPIIFLIFSWSLSKFWWIGLANCLFFLLDSIARRQLIVYVNAEKISYPSWPKKEIQWSELNNVILKDRLLTIDLKTNKLLQQEIINSESDYDIDQNDFNNFCKEQLNKAELYKLN